MKFGAFIVALGVSFTINVECMKTISSSNSQKRTVQTKLYKITKIAPPYSLKQFDLKTSVLLYHGYIVANPKLPKDVLLDCLQKKDISQKVFHLNC